MTAPTEQSTPQDEDRAYDDLVARRKADIQEFTQALTDNKQTVHDWANDTDISLSDQFYKLDEKTKNAIVLGIDPEQSGAQMVEQINQIIERLNNGEQLEDILPDMQIEYDDDTILAATENGRGDAEHN